MFKEYLLLKILLLKNFILTNKIEINIKRIKKIKNNNKKLNKLISKTHKTLTLKQSIQEEIFKKNVYLNAKKDNKNVIMKNGYPKLIGGRYLC